MEYRFRRGTPAILVEIYLPKKSAFQGALYEALTEGNDPVKLKEHLLAHADKIRSMLHNDWTEAAAHLTESFVDELAASIGDIYRGYSMYEVDGVFFAPGSASPAEERTQVIRIFFEYKLGDEADDGLVDDVKRFLRSPSSSLKQFEPARRKYLRELK